MWPLLRFLRRGIFTIELKDVFEVEIKGLLEQAPRPTELVFRVADFSDIQSLGPAFAHEYTTEVLAFVETRLRVGDKAVVGYLDEHPVFSGWSMFGYMELSRDEYLPIPDHVVCVYKLFTIASMRRQGVWRRSTGTGAGVLDGLGLHSQKGGGVPRQFDVGGGAPEIGIQTSWIYTDGRDSRALSQPIQPLQHPKLLSLGALALQSVR